MMHSTKSVLAVTRSVAANQLAQATTSRIEEATEPRISDVISICSTLQGEHMCRYGRCLQPWRHDG
jgi:hypothetical protein